MARFTKSEFLRGYGIALQIIGFIILIPGVVLLFTKDNGGWELLLVGAAVLIIARLFISGSVIVRAAEQYLHDKGHIEFYDRDEIERLRQQNNANQVQTDKSEN